MRKCLGLLLTGCVGILFSACARAAMGPGAGAGEENGAESVVRREARLLSMVDQRQADTLLVDALLRDGDAGRRARTALAIGQVRMKARYPVLRQLLVDGDTSIAANAAYALGIGKDTAALVMLARAVAGAPDPVAREAAWSLGEIGEPARTVLTVALGEGQARPLVSSTAAQRAPAVRAALLLATVKLRPAPIPLVTPWLADTSAEVVRAAAYVIGRLRAPAGARAVMTVRAHRDEEVRQHVARALTRATVGDSLATPAREALRVLVRDSSERVRVNAARSLASFGPAVADQVDPLFRDPAANVRVAIAEVAGEPLGKDLARWQRAWNADTALAVRRLLLGQARRLDVNLAPEIETEWSGNTDWQYRVAAVAAVDRESAAARRDTAVAIRLLADRDPRVQRAARMRLGRRDSTANGAANAAGGANARSTTPQPRPLADYEALVRRYVLNSTPTRAFIDTDRGTITLELFGREAPLVVEAFVRLAQNGTYRNTWFHRVVPNFVVQDGDASGDGSGASGFTLRESWTRKRHERGCLGLATSGPDTGGSQYYLCHSSQPHLDGGYTVFGRVIDGYEVMDRIVQGDRMLRVRVP
ncbi:peptidylprolyl isomerase [Gemmatimonas aurantiaca]|uniref:peptidylprolyl isomerase n=1 Tax=Gemmatimonas aurantiaca TaxID=173480 RepID=UPI00301C80F9